MISLVRQLLRNPRVTILFFVWTVPCVVYVVLGIIALYQTGWLVTLAWVLPLNWLAAWLIATYWKPTVQEKHQELQPIIAPAFWTDRDQGAIQLVESYRRSVTEIDDNGISDPQRYIADAQQLSRLLAAHYYGKTESEALHPVTIVEILAVIHLAVEDLEVWTQENFPGSEIATVGHLARIPGLTKQVNTLSNLTYFASVIFQPIKILAYPLYRKSGAIATQIRLEIVNALYQKYLQQAGFYLIEMYSGRLKAGSRVYKDQFAHLSKAIHHAKGDKSVLERLTPESTSIALLGQVKAGKSSLINLLLQQQEATTSILPETKEVKRFRFMVPDTSIPVTLLDTPGYSEADATTHQVSEITKGVESADIVFLVLAANSPAKQADVRLLVQLEDHYKRNPHLKPPKVIGVLTHIDQLRPIREWLPPYDWRSPRTDKEHSIAEAVKYCREVFGSHIDDYEAVCTKEGASEYQNEAIGALMGLVMERLNDGKSVAIVRSYYERLKQNRLERVVDQLGNLMKRSLAK